LSRLCPKVTPGCVYFQPPLLRTRGGPGLFGLYPFSKESPQRFLKALTRQPGCRTTCSVEFPNPSLALLSASINPVGEIWGGNPSTFFADYSASRAGRCGLSPPHAVSCSTQRAAAVTLRGRLSVLRLNRGPAFLVFPRGGGFLPRGLCRRITGSSPLSFTARVCLPLWVPAIHSAAPRGGCFRLPGNT